MFRDPRPLSDALLGVVGAMCVYILINVEPDWNRAGCYTRCITMGVVATALLWLGGMPTIGAEHVVSNAGHAAGFVAGGALAYNGMAPLFTSARGGATRGYERSARVARRRATEGAEERGMGGG
jgi:hypothetical protein